MQDKIIGTMLSILLAHSDAGLDLDLVLVLLLG